MTGVDHDVIHGTAAQAYRNDAKHRYCHRSSCLFWWGHWNRWPRFSTMKSVWARTLASLRKYVMYGDIFCTRTHHMAALVHTTVHTTTATCLLAFIKIEWASQYFSSSKKVSYNSVVANPDSVGKIREISTPVGSTWVFPECFLSST